MRRITLILAAVATALALSSFSAAHAKSPAVSGERSIQSGSLLHTAFEASGIEFVDRDADTLLTLPGHASGHADRTSSLLVAVEDYVPGGVSFHPSSTLAAPQTLDLRETGSTDVPASDNFFGPDGPGLADLIDVINPLQQLPVVGLLYRAVTGDTIAPAAQLAGGSLYGGVAGLFVAAGTVFVEEAAGDDMHRSLTAMVDHGDSQAHGPSTRLADAAPVSANTRMAASEPDDVF